MSTAAQPVKRATLKQELKSSKRLLMIWVIAGLVALMSILLVSSQKRTGADSPECRSVYMYPSYARLKAFDTSHTKFASKYNLFLYREQGKDKIPDENYKENPLDGIPVLFIPGNAGSFKQVRSIASQVSNVYHDNLDDEHYKNKNFDVFAAHFNEDFTAFHGRTMLDQAEYLNDAIAFILSLYDTPSSGQSPPKSVIIIGHSMGGIVARVMLTLPNYVEDSVNTIITLAAPHAAAPATFDADIVTIYATVDKFWRSGFSNSSDPDSISHERLRNVSLVSITGGLLDTILPADYTTLKGLVPPEHGFTVYTTGIPQVWTPIDHLAIVWCHQLRIVLANTLFAVVDPSSPSRTKPLEQRMDAFHEILQSGFEKEVYPPLSSSKSLQVLLDRDHVTFESSSLNLTSDSKVHLIPIHETKDTGINMVSSFPLLKYDGLEKSPFLLLCNNSTTSDDSLRFDSIPATDKLDLTCIDISSFSHPLPNTMNPESKLSDSTYGGDLNPLYGMALNLSTQQFQYAVYKSPEAQPDSFIDFQIGETVNVVVNKSLLQLLFGTTVSLTNISTNMVTNIEYKNVWDSLLSYRVQVDTHSSNPNFHPIMRQHIDEPMESKWHIHLDKPHSISFHGVAPYTPFERGRAILNLQLWFPPDTTDLTVSLRIDLWNSLGLLVLRYRLAIASLPSVVILLSMIYQFSAYFNSGIFPPFEEGLVALSKYSMWIFLVLSILTPLTSSPLFNAFLYYLGPVSLTPPSVSNSLSLNQFFLGLEDNHIWTLGPLLFSIALALVYIVLRVIQLILLLSRNIGCLSKVMSCVWIGKLKQVVHISSFKQKRRFFGSIALVIFVTIFIPYQFAYLVCCIVQAVTTIKWNAEVNQKEKVDISKVSLLNFNVSILMLMLWVLPVNIPVLVVFLHNMAVRWYTPFTSHHNILMILPVISLVGRNVQGIMLPSTQGWAQKKFTILILVYSAFFVLIYGIRHLYWLHYLLNCVFVWLFVPTLPSFSKPSQDVDS